MDHQFPTRWIKWTSAYLISWSRHNIQPAVAPTCHFEVAPLMNPFGLRNIHIGGHLTLCNFYLYPILTCFPEQLPEGAVVALTWLPRSVVHMKALDSWATVQDQRHAAMPPPRTAPQQVADRALLLDFIKHFLRMLASWTSPPSGCSATGPSRPGPRPSGTAPTARAGSGSLPPGATPLMESSRQAVPYVVVIVAVVGPECQAGSKWSKSHALDQCFIAQLQWDRNPRLDLDTLFFSSSFFSVSLTSDASHKQVRKHHTELQRSRRSYLH